MGRSRLKRLACLIAAGGALAGCAADPHLGRPIAEAVGDLGVPDQITDDQSGRRYFSWVTTDVIMMDMNTENPANWLSPMTRMNAPKGLNEAELDALPKNVERARFSPSGCTFTLVAEWDVGAKAWVARKAMSKGGSVIGSCSMLAGD